MAASGWQGSANGTVCTESFRLDGREPHVLPPVGELAGSDRPGAEGRHPAAPRPVAPTWPNARLRWAFAAFGPGGAELNPPLIS